MAADGEQGVQWSRREFLRRSFLTAGAIGVVPWGASFAAGRSGPLQPPGTGSSAIAAAGELQAADELGVRLPAGWSYRVVAVSGQRPAADSPYVWHPFPDGGATFALPDGGWVYCNNSEFPLTGGVGALRFDRAGRVIQAYSILNGTNLNCAGGPTPWGTWLSCEEASNGRVWECDPSGRQPGRELPALGIFQHEAVCVDAPNKTLYLTEDQSDGRFYRFVCSRSDWPLASARPRLEDGRLQVLRIGGSADSSYPPEQFDVRQPMPAEWVDVVAPSLPQAKVRDTMGASAPGNVFKGGEGLWYFNGVVYFSTKGDNRIWALDTTTQTLQAIYHFGSAEEPDNILSGVDNLTVSAYGDVLVAEDGGDLQLCAILPSGRVKPILQLLGQDESELTGPAFSPDGRRIYVNSQRGRPGGSGLGTTYEILLPYA